MSRHRLLILAAVVTVLIMFAFLANREGGLDPFSEDGYRGSPIETTPQQPQP